jgi:hypothetical protein
VVWGGSTGIVDRTCGLEPIPGLPSGGIRQAYWVRAVPETFAINRDGEIVNKWAGAVGWDSDAPRGLLDRLLEM